MKGKKLISIVLMFALTLCITAPLQADTDYGVSPTAIFEEAENTY